MGSSPLILCIEDDESIRIALSAYLESFDFSVICAKDILEARSAVEAHRAEGFHAIISDFQLSSEGNGLDFFNEVERGTCKVNVYILISAGGPNDQVCSTLSASTRVDFRYFAKPLDLNHMLKILTE